MNRAGPRAGSGGRPAALAVLAVVGILLVSLNLRTAVTSLSPVLDLIDTELGLGDTGKSLLGMIPTAMFALWGWGTPRLLRRLRLETVAVVAMTAAAIGLLIRALAPDPYVLAAGSVLALSGMGMGNVVAPPLVKTYFPERVAGMSMLYITGLQIGTVVPALVAVPVADAAGWRMSVGWWTALAAVAAVPWLMILVSTRPSRRDAATATAAAAEGRVRVRPWRSPVGISVALFFGTNSLITYAFFGWLPAIASSVGKTASEGGTALAVFSALGLIGALGVPWVAGRLEDPYIVVVGAMACYLVGFVGLVLAPGPGWWLWVVLLGLGPCTFPLCLTLVNLRTRTPEGSAALSGFAQGIGYTMACLGPLVFGALFTGPGLTAGVVFLTVVVAVMAVVARAACRPRMLEDAEGVVEH